MVCVLLLLGGIACVSLFTALIFNVEIIYEIANNLHIEYMSSRDCNNAINMIVSQNRSWKGHCRSHLKNQKASDLDLRQK